MQTVAFIFFVEPTVYFLECCTSSDIPAAPAVWATVWVIVSVEDCCLLSCSWRDRFPRMLRSRVMRVAVRSEERVYWDASHGSKGSGISVSPSLRPYNRACNSFLTCADTWGRNQSIYKWKLQQDKCIICCINTTHRFMYGVKPVAFPLTSHHPLQVSSDAAQLCFQPLNLREQSSMRLLRYASTAE